MGCLEFQPFSRPVIQSIFDHSQLLIEDSFHTPLLVNVLAQQPAEVPDTGSLPTTIWIGTVGLYAKAVIDDLVIGKLFDVVFCQSLHPGVQGLELGLNGPSHQISTLVGPLVGTANHFCVPPVSRWVVCELRQ